MHKNSAESGADFVWIQKYLESRNNEYLSRLYERYKERIFLLCLRMVRNVKEAKDLTSETFLRAFQHIGEFRPGSPFYPWLSRIATNFCIDQLRRRSRYWLESIKERHVVADDPDEPLERSSAENEKIFRIIQKLKPPQRKCFCFFYIHNLSYKEIAELTGLTYDQVRSHIQNGRRRFKILMEES